MLVRIVKMSFIEDQIDTFRLNFNAHKEQIRNFEGCRFLELYRDTQDPHIFFTYSHWDSETDLEYYRNSQLFKKVWAKTKPLFKDKAVAWSLDTLESLI